MLFKIKRITFLGKNIFCSRFYKIVWVLPRNGLTELNMRRSFNCLKMPLSRYGLTSKTFSSLLSNIMLSDSGSRCTWHILTQKYNAAAVGRAAFCAPHGSGMLCDFISFSLNFSFRFFICLYVILPLNLLADTSDSYPHPSTIQRLQILSFQRIWHHHEVSVDLYHQLP
jgi:hypothetical protein